ncbi:MAG: hypothetical protein ACTTHU_06215 [Treponema sp.]
MQSKKNRAQPGIVNGFPLQCRAFPLQSGAGGFFRRLYNLRFFTGQPQCPVDKKLCAGVARKFLHLCAFAHGKSGAGLTFRCLRVFLNSAGQPHTDPFFNSAAFKA